MFSKGTTDCYKVVLVVAAVLLVRSGLITGKELPLRGFKTDISKAIIDLSELRGGGPPKDGIPAILFPKFIAPYQAKEWLKPNEPVISVVINERAKAYPLQILVWHELINDSIAETPVVVGFCPLCYSAVVYKSKIDNRKYTFGVSGTLRNSNLVMYDHKTETFWQQITGQAIVGDLVGHQLEPIPAQIIAFRQFTETYKNGLVLSRDTGYRRDYGRNPYLGYDDVSSRPFMYSGRHDDRLPPMEKVVTVSIGEQSMAYPYSTTAKQKVINDRLGDRPLTIFHGPGAVSALDKRRIAASRHVGSTGVFDRRVQDKTLTFIWDNDSLKDDQTRSTWDITGRAIAGPLQDTQLESISHGDYFAFAWFAFKPETKVYKAQKQ